MTPNLLVVDDDTELCVMLRDFFGAEGLNLEFAGDGAIGVAQLQRKPYDLMILDVMLPGLNGFEVLRQTRQNCSIPIIMLTARTGREDRLQGFASGADDYLAKPFCPEELLARVRAILRRSGAQPSPPPLLRSGELTLFPGSRNAFNGGKQLDLTAMECEVLEQLLRSAGRVVSRDQLSMHLYNRIATPFDRSVDAHVSRIRRKLGSARSMIKSVRGTGYQLCSYPVPTDI